MKELELYDRITLKNGRTATIVEILEPDIAYVVDVDLGSNEWDTIEIRRTDIKD